MREAILEEKIRLYIKSQGGMALKWVSPGFTGVPDRIILMPGGIIIFAEIKRPGLKDGRSPRQKYVASLLEMLGFTVWRISDFEVFKNDLQTLLLSKIR